MLRDGFRRKKDAGELSVSADDLARKILAAPLFSIGPGGIHLAVDAAQPPAELLLREGFGFHSRAESLRARDLHGIVAKSKRDDITEVAKLPKGHLEECRLEGIGGDTPTARFARRPAESARRGPEIVEDGVLGEPRPSLEVDGSASQDTLPGFVAAVPREVEMVVGMGQRDEQCPLVKRACFLVPRDVFRPALDAFVHNLAEDDELKPREQTRKFLVRFGEVRKDRLQGERVHGFRPLRRRSGRAAAVAISRDNRLPRRPRGAPRHSRPRRTRILARGWRPSDRGLRDTTAHRARA